MTPQRSKISYLLTLLVLFGAVGNADAAERTDVYAVSGVQVEERAQDEVAAKTKGMAAGQQRALDILLRRLTLRADHDRLPSVGDSEVRSMVRDLSVANEKIGGGRYIAELNVRFYPAEVRRLLDSAQIPYTETPSRPVVVLPVIQEGGATRLWDEPNPWLRAWGQRPAGYGLVPIVVPLGDLNDVSQITAEQALSGAVGRLNLIAGNYQASETIVVVAQLSGGDKPRLEVAVNRYGGAYDGQTSVQSFVAEPSESREALLARAADRVALELEANWKRDTIVSSGSQQVLEVLVPVNGLSDWLTIRDTLQGIPLVAQVDVRRMTIREAIVDLHYRGQPEQLKLAVAQSNLNLDFVENRSAWVLRRTGFQ